MTAPVEISEGSRFGRWTVLRRGSKTKNWQQKWICQCDCGTEREVGQDHLKAGRSVSCGCYQRDVLSGMKTIHGHAARGRKTTEYTIWESMRARCNTPTNRAYHHYGGRGIKLCERWQDSFEAFLADMGPRPSKRHSVDRIDNNGDYEPGNCKWATRAEQLANTRRSVPVERSDGEIFPTMAHGARSIGITPPCIQDAVRTGRESGGYFWKKLDYDEYLIRTAAKEG